MSVTLVQAGTVFERIARSAALFVMALFALCGIGADFCANAQSIASMPDGGIVMPPAGWLDYCGRNPSDPGCDTHRAAAAPIELDEAHMATLKQVEGAITAIRRVTDERRLGKSDYWEVARTAGDCEDIALAARQRLLAAGWPASALRLATAYTEDREYHAVLTIDVVRDGQPETYVIDNRFARPMHWQRLEDRGYRFVTRQASAGPNWVAVG